MSDRAMEDLGLQIEIGAMKLEKWVFAGLRKLYPTASDAQLMAILGTALERAGDSQYEQDQILAELVHRFRAVGHTVETLEA